MFLLSKALSIHSIVYTSQTGVPLDMIRSDLRMSALKASMSILCMGL